MSARAVHYNHVVSFSCRLLRSPCLCVRSGEKGKVIISNADDYERNRLAGPLLLFGRRARVLQSYGTTYGGSYGHSPRDSRQNTRNHETTGRATQDALGLTVWNCPHVLQVLLSGKFTTAVSARE